MRTPLVSLALLCLVSTCFARKPLIGGPKTIEVPAEGPLAQNVVGTQAGMGGYVSGAKKVAVPLVAVAFETNSEARTSRSHGGDITTRSLKLHLKADDAVFKSIASKLQAMVEDDLRAQGFEVLPSDSVDTDPRWQGIVKKDPVGVEVKDNFTSGFMGNGTFNTWYTAGDRGLFGTGATGALSELSPLIHIAREKKISLLFYRFKVQFSDVDTSNGIIFNFIEGKNVLHMISADMSVFTPEHTLGSMVKLKANLTAGTNFIRELQTLQKGEYNVVIEPAQYEADSLRLIKVVSQQFAQALKKAN